MRYSLGSSSAGLSNASPLCKTHKRNQVKQRREKTQRLIGLSAVEQTSDLLLQLLHEHVVDGSHFVYLRGYHHLCGVHGIVMTRTKTVTRGEEFGALRSSGETT